MAESAAYPLAPEDLSQELLDLVQQAGNFKQLKVRREWRLPFRRSTRNADFHFRKEPTKPQRLSTEASARSSFSQPTPALSPSSCTCLYYARTRTCLTSTSQVVWPSVVLAVCPALSSPPPSPATRRPSCKARFVPFATRSSDFSFESLQNWLDTFSCEASTVQ